MEETQHRNTANKDPKAVTSTSASRDRKISDEESAITNSSQEDNLDQINSDENLTATNSQKETQRQNTNENLTIATSSREEIRQETTITTTSSSWGEAQCPNTDRENSKVTTTSSSWGEAQCPSTDRENSKVTTTSSSQGEAQCPSTDSESSVVMATSSPGEAQCQNVIDENSTATTLSQGYLDKNHSSPLYNVPVEVFIKICKDIPPRQLYYLSKSCKKFHALLISTDFGTEQIWRSSRRNFMPKLPEPPRTFWEGQWLFLNMIDLGCQFCGSGAIEPKGNLPSEEPVKTYWIFRVMCCKRELRVEEEKKFLLKFLPCLEFNKRPNIYWKSDVERAYEEFHNLPREELKGWISDKLKKVYAKRCTESYCEDACVKNSEIRNHKMKRFRNVANVLSSKVPNDARMKITKVISKIKELPTYKKYWKNMSSVVLFNDHHWQKFEEILLKEWNNNRRDAIKAVRLFSIVLKIYDNYAPGSALFSYLYHCPTFRGNYPPQFSDPDIPLDESFVDNEFIPELIIEAYEIANKSERPPPIITIEGVKKFGYKDRLVIQCKLCKNSSSQNNGLYTINGVQKHLKAEHDFEEDTKEMENFVEVDWVEAQKSSSVIKSLRSTIVQYEIEIDSLKSLNSALKSRLAKLQADTSADYEVELLRDECSKLRLDVSKSLREKEEQMIKNEILQEEVSRLKNENKNLKNENYSLQDENSEIKSRNLNLNSRLNDKESSSRLDYLELKRELSGLMNENSRMANRNHALQEEVAKLKRDHEEVQKERDNLMKFSKSRELTELLASIKINDDGPKTSELEFGHSLVTPIYDNVYQ
ncbi:14910_t:CDS:2 [Acaulospora colombiana]|uniref:14910_t:CDS:1 n=1 Tax=Acaulospora colombiana TaxID=27376 RepID=A0ACA9KH83_9GLOM|nr:14910_t:CDS:2 [Acaulospora colombiana]